MWESTLYITERLQVCAGFYVQHTADYSTFTICAVQETDSIPVPKEESLLVIDLVAT